MFTESLLSRAGRAEGARMAGGRAALLGTDASAANVTTRQLHLQRDTDSPRKALRAESLTPENHLYTPAALPNVPLTPRFTPRPTPMPVPHQTLSQQAASNPRESHHTHSNWTSGDFIF